MAFLVLALILPFLAEADFFAVFFLALVFLAAFETCWRGLRLAAGDVRAPFFLIVLPADFAMNVSKA